jgi:hypothetical protein
MSLTTIEFIPIQIQICWGHQKHINKPTSKLCPGAIRRLRSMVLLLNLSSQDVCDIAEQLGW